MDWLIVPPVHRPWHRRTIARASYTGSSRRLLPNWTTLRLQWKNHPSSSIKSLSRITNGGTECHRYTGCCCRWENFAFLRFISSILRKEIGEDIAATTSNVNERSFFAQYQTGTCRTHLQSSQPSLAFIRRKELEYWPCQYFWSIGSIFQDSLEWWSRSRLF